ncbi:hypothetical protein BJX70DRAFT_400133 [Aspergillus crustosus]
MDFLAVPFVSVFILPTLSLYSTRLNFIFFYMTWTTLVLTHNARRVELYGTMAARVVCYFLPSILFFIFDAAAPGTSSLFKERGEQGLPSGNKKTPVTQKELRIVGWSLLNFSLSLVLQMALETFLIFMPGFWSAVRVWMTIPMPWDIVKDLFYGFFIREIITFYTHRYILHSTDPNSYIASLHKSWYHNLQTPFPLTAHYDHPLCYIIGTFLPMYIPVFLIQFHMLTFLVYTVIISLEDLFAFSGYYVLPSIMLRGVGRRIDAHLASGGKAHFGRWGFWDVFRGTGGSREGEESTGSSNSRGKGRA